MHLQPEDGTAIGAGAIAAAELAALSTADGRLHLPRRQARALRKRVHLSALNVLSLGGSDEVVLQVKGPGQVLGELNMMAGMERVACGVGVGGDASRACGGRTYAYSARAREDTVCIRLSEDALMQALLQVSHSCAYNLFWRLWLTFINDVNVCM